MTHRATTELYDLSEAGRRLFRGPRTLQRAIRQRRFPGVCVGGAWALPRAWVDAESGQTAVDAEALRVYWTQRLAPPSPEAHRARRGAERLAGRKLLSEAEAGARLCCTPTALRRMAADGTLPSLRLDGITRYDARLVDLLARSQDESAECAELATERSAVEQLSACEYVTQAPEPLEPHAQPAQSQAGGSPGRTGSPNQERPATKPADGPDTTSFAPGPAPAAYAIPEELFEATPRLIQAEGFETVDED